MEFYFNTSGIARSSTIEDRALAEDRESANYGKFEELQMEYDKALAKIEPNWKKFK